MILRVLVVLIDGFGHLWTEFTEACSQWFLKMFSSKTIKLTQIQPWSTHLIRFSHLDFYKKMYETYLLNSPTLVHCVTYG